MSQPKRVLVTGAGGFVCRHIIQAVLDNGMNVIAVDRSFDTNLHRHWTTNYAGRIQILEFDLNALPSLPVDFVVHGAAITASAKEMGVSAEDHLRANLEITLDLLAWADRNHAQRTICISSSAVYRETDGIVTEDQPTTPDNLYAIAKATTESLVETLRRSFGRDVITIRLSNIYGTGEISRLSRPRVSLITRMVGEALTTGKISIDRPDEARDWTSASDVGQAVCALLNQTHLNHALYNVASEQVLTTHELAETIISHMPEAYIVFAQSEDTSSLTRRGYLSHQRLLDDTGFDDWTPLFQGIAQVIQHFRTLEATR